MPKKLMDCRYNNTDNVIVAPELPDLRRMQVLSNRGKLVLVLKRTQFAKAMFLRLQVS